MKDHYAAPRARILESWQIRAIIEIYRRRNKALRKVGFKPDARTTAALTFLEKFTPTNRKDAPHV